MNHKKPGKLENLKKWCAWSGIFFVSNIYFESEKFLSHLKNSFFKKNQEHFYQKRTYNIYRYRKGINTSSKSHQITPKVKLQCKLFHSYSEGTCNEMHYFIDWIRTIGDRDFEMSGNLGEVRETFDSSKL